MHEQTTLQNDTESHENDAEVLTHEEALLLLSYSDVLQGDEAEAALESNRRSDSAAKYTDTLVEMSREVGSTELRSLAQSMRDTCTATLDAVGITPSTHGRSESWALWDLAKQRYMSQHPDESDERYRATLADPLAKDEQAASKRTEIIDRHVGWELDNALSRSTTPHSARSSDATVGKLYVKPIMKEIRAIVAGDERKPDGQLPSDALSQVGALVRQEATQLYIPASRVPRPQPAPETARPQEDSPDRRTRALVTSVLGDMVAAAEASAPPRPRRTRVTSDPERPIAVDRETFVTDMESRRPTEAARRADLAARHLVAQVLAPRHPDADTSEQSAAAQPDTHTAQMPYDLMHQRLEEVDELQMRYEAVAHWKAA